MDPPCLIQIKVARQFPANMVLSYPSGKSMNLRTILVDLHEMK